MNTELLAPRPSEPASGDFAGHTPGPWKFFPVSEEDGSVEVVPCVHRGEENVSGMALIARVSRWRGQPEFHAQASANARLIAAAPTLLQRLEQAEAANVALRGERDALVVSRDAYKRDAEGLLKISALAADALTKAGAEAEALRARLEAQGVGDARERELAMLCSTLIQRLRKANPADPWLEKAWRILGKHGHNSLLRDATELCIACGGKGEVIGTYNPSGDPQNASDMPMDCLACDATGTTPSVEAQPDAQGECYDCVGHGVLLDAGISCPRCGGSGRAALSTNTPTGGEDTSL